MSLTKAKSVWWSSLVFFPGAMAFAWAADILLFAYPTRAGYEAVLFLGLGLFALVMTFLAAVFGVAQLLFVDVGTDVDNCPIVSGLFCRAVRIDRSYLRRVWSLRLLNVASGEVMPCALFRHKLLLISVKDGTL